MIIGFFIFLTFWTNIHGQYARIISIEIVYLMIDHGKEAMLLRMDIESTLELDKIRLKNPRYDQNKTKTAFGYTVYIEIWQHIFYGTIIIEHKFSNGTYLYDKNQLELKICDKKLVPQVKIKNDTDNEIIVKKSSEVILSIILCEKEINIQDYITMNENVSFYQKIFRGDLYNSFKFSYEGFKLFQFWKNNNKKLYTVLVHDGLTIGIKMKYTIKNYICLCSSNLPAPMSEFTWKFRIKDKFVRLSEDEKIYEHYTKDQRFILTYVSMVNQSAVHISSELPTSVYALSCTVRYRIRSDFIKHVDSIHLDLNSPVINKTGELINSTGNDDVRGIIVHLDNVFNYPNLQWEAMLNKQDWFNLSKDLSNNTVLFVPIPERLIGQDILLKIKCCVYSRNRCINWKSRGLTYCDNGNIPKLEIGSTKVHMLAPNQSLLTYHSCSSSENMEKYIILNENISLFQKRFVKGIYFIYTVSFSVEFRLLQLWIEKNKSLQTILIAGKVEVYIPAMVNSSNSDIECKTDLPSYISKLSWSCLIRDKWMQLNIDRNVERESYTKYEKDILKYILIKKDKFIYFSSNLSTNIYICKCRAELRFLDSVMFDEKEIVTDLFDPIIGETEEYIISERNDHVRGIIVHLTHVEKYYISHWRVSLLRNKWFTLGRDNSNDTHLFIPIDESFIKTTIHLRLKSCLYYITKCISWQSKMIKYCETENMNYNLNKVKDLSIWRTRSKLGSVYSCKDTLPNLVSMFNPFTMIKIKNARVHYNRVYFAYDFYLKSKTVGFYQFLFIKKSNKREYGLVYSIIIYDEIKLSVKPDYYNLNMTNRCVTNLPDGMVIYKWQCWYKDTPIPLDRPIIYMTHSQIFNNFKVLGSKTIYFGNDLPLLYYYCFCQVSFYFKGKNIVEKLQFEFDFRSLNLDRILAKLLKRPFPYWLFVMFLWFLFLCAVFSYIVYNVTMRKNHKQCVRRFEYYYGRIFQFKKRPMYNYFHAPRNFALTLELEKLKKRKVDKNVDNSRTGKKIFKFRESFKIPILERSLSVRKRKWDNQMKKNHKHLFEYLERFPKAVPAETTEVDTLRKFGKENVEENSSLSSINRMKTGTRAKSFKIISEPNIRKESLYQTKVKVLLYPKSDSDSSKLFPKENRRQLFLSKHFSKRGSQSEPQLTSKYNQNEIELSKPISEYTSEKLSKQRNSRKKSLYQTKVKSLLNLKPENQPFKQFTGEEKERIGDMIVHNMEKLDKNKREKDVGKFSTNVGEDAEFSTNVDEIWVKSMFKDIVISFDSK